MKILEKLGLSQKEASIFTTLLKLGASEVREISQISGIKRPTVYFCLERLIKLGVIEVSVKKGKKAYSAVDPEELLKLVRAQKAEIEAKENSLMKALPRLQALAAASPATMPHVRIYEGVMSLWKLGSELLHDRHDLLFVYSGNTVLAHTTLAQILKKFTKKRRQIGGSKLYAITDRNLISEKRFQEGDTLFREYRFLSKPITFNSIFCLCGDKIVLVSFEKVPQAIVIESVPIAQILCFLFWSLWESLGRDEKTK
ncbi:MAG: helix-turn-helix domain-containing protein [Patescibacteria group bacterium]